MRKAYYVTLYPGEGIGPEATEAAVRMIAATGVQIDWDRQIVGEAALRQFGNPLPDAALTSFERTRIALKGPLNTPPGGKIRDFKKR